MDGRGSGSRGALYRRTRSRLSWNRQKLTQTLCRTAATVSERDGGLLGKRHGRSAFALVVSQAVDPGLLQVMERDLIHAARKGCAEPTQPTTTRGRSSLHHFTVVFDREGYSPIFLAAMKKKRIACLTYHKHPGEVGPGKNSSHSVRLASGQETTMQLAERGGCQISCGCADPQAEPEQSPDRDSQHRLPDFGGAFGSRRCSPAGLRKTSTNICGKATVWIALWTIGPAPVPGTTRSSIRPIGPSMAGPQNGRQPQPQKREFSLEPRGEMKPKTSRPSRSANPLSETSNI